MNRKRIEQKLQAKHEELCKSIHDTGVRALVEKRSIITGGSIVSLLTGAKVNDYDYYFTDFETALAVAKYYVDEFNALNPNVKPPHYKEPIKPEVRVTDDKIVKVYVKSAGIIAELEAAQTPEHLQLEYRPTYLTDHAITLAKDFQLITRFYGTPEQVHKNFDFVHCMNYWESDSGKLTLDAQALESIVTMHLHYVGSLYPVCSVVRTRKFIQRGWKINAGQFLKMCFQCSELDLTNFDVLEDQLTGVDVYYFQQIIAYLRERKEKDKDFKITASYLADIVDRIFIGADE